MLPRPQRFGQEVRQVLSRGNVLDHDTVAISSLLMFSISVVISNMSLKQGDFKQAYVFASMLERVGMDRASPTKTLGGYGKEMQKFDSQEGIDLEFQKPLGELR